MKRFALLFVLAFGVSTAPAQAFMEGIDLHRYYVELKLGAGAHPHPQADVTGFPTGEYRPDEGVFVGGAIGAYFMPMTRAEFEFSYGHAEDGVFDFGPALPHTGDVTLWTSMFNVYHEFDVRDWFRPYFGGGVGFTVIEIDTLGATGGGFATDDTEAAALTAAYVGIDVPINDMFTVSTRYTIGINHGADFDTTAPGIKTDMEPQFYQFLTLGLRMAIN